MSHIYIYIIYRQMLISYICVCDVAAFPHPMI